MEIIANYKERINGRKQHTFQIRLSDHYYDSDDIDAVYDFRNDFNKIAIVKTNFYPKVLLITSRFKLMLTNWDSIEDAEWDIAFGKLKAHYVHIDGKPFALVADEDQDISSVFLQIPIIMKVEDFVQPQYYERNTKYAKMVDELNSPSFYKIRQLSVDYILEIRWKLNALINDLNRGVNILTTNEQLHTYMYCFGNMHEAKLKKAFSKIPSIFFRENESIEIIDYACGQGLATICLQEYIREEDIDTAITHITLIEPSEKALSRASLLCHKVLPETSINSIRSKFDDINEIDLRKGNKARIHLLSNILDMDGYSLYHLASLVKTAAHEGDIVVCTDPYYGYFKRDGRQREFMRLLHGQQIYHEVFCRNELATSESWTANITLFWI